MIYKVAFLFFAVLASVFATPEVEYQNAFTGWMQKHGKSYSTVDFRDRYAIFKSNMDYINAWNAVNQDTVLGLNHLADLTNKEYREIYLGTKIDGTARLAAARASRSLNKPNQAIISKKTTNSTVDWRDKKVVSEIKNQGQCGGCWSFSTTGSVEGAHALATGKLVSLSEQNLIDCSTANPNAGCNGGLMDTAFQYIIDNKGIDTEEAYPYEMINWQDGEPQSKTCRYKESNKGATISSFTDVKAGDESDLESAVNKQPVSVAIDASQTSFQLYQSGVYNENSCSSTALDHGVLAVGYGKDKNKEYWIVKNSWGTTWGQEGYIWMSKNKSNQCGIATSASYPTV